MTVKTSGPTPQWEYCRSRWLSSLYPVVLSWIWILLESGYHRLSLVETGIVRLKAIFGDKLSARNEAAQEREWLLRCAVLNRMK